MTFDVTRRGILKSVAGVAGAGVGISGLTGSTRAVSMAKVDVAIHLSGRGNEHASYREDVEDAIDSLDEQLPLVDIEHEPGVAVDDDIDTDDEERTICEIEKTLAAEGMLNSYDVHLIVFTGNPLDAEEMGGAGFNMWKVGTPSSKFSANEVEDTDSPFYRMNAPERDAETDGGENNCEEIHSGDSSADESEGDYAFAFVNDIYIDNDFIDQLLEVIAGRYSQGDDVPDVEDLGDSEVIDVLSPVNIPNFDQMVKNTVVHEICHCMGAKHNDGTVYKGDKKYNGPGSDMFGAFVPHHYKISPMCTWYVEELMEVADDLALQDQSMKSKSDLCDAAKGTGDKHTIELSDCTIEAIREHFSCDLEVVNLTVDKMEGLDGKRWYQATATSNCRGGDISWEFQSAESPEITTLTWGSATLDIQEPGDYTLEVTVTRNETSLRATEEFTAEYVTGESESAETSPTGEEEGDSDPGDSETGSEVPENEDTGDDADDTGSGRSSGYGGGDRNTPVDTPDMCTGNICFD